MQPEKVFEKKVREWLHSQHISPSGAPITPDQKGWYFKVWGGGYQVAGIPDLIMCVNGKFVAVELKSDKGKATPLQIHNIKSINQSNGLAIVARPSDFELLKICIEGVIDQCNILTVE